MDRNKNDEYYSRINLNDTVYIVKLKSWIASNIKVIE